MRTALLACCAVAIAACGGRERAAEQLAPEKLYERAHRTLMSGDHRNAVRYYEALEARYPFSEYARQARLDILYAYYKSRQPESAIDSADQFIRENPTHPRVDYAWYIKGLVHFERSANFLERWFRADLTHRPPQDARSSFQSFATLVERYPDSPYAHDARARMIFLRNRLADYEVYVANYYLKRKAWVAALARARYCVENYDGAPAIRRAVEIMTAAYEGLGLEELAAQSSAVYALNYSGTPPRSRRRRDWWPFW